MREAPAEPAPRRSWRVATGVIITVEIIAGSLAVLLLFSHVTAHGSHCGTILFPKEPPGTGPNALIAGCGSARFGQMLLAVGCAALAIACIAVQVHRRRHDQQRANSGDISQS